MDVKKKVYNAFKEAIGVNPAFREAVNSRMPGLHNGPADAYRHILGAAELTRRHGEAAARAALYAHEEWANAGEPPAERRMDNHNNAIGIAIGRQAGSHDEVVAKAREAIDSAVKHGGNGKDGTPLWLDHAQWHDDRPATNWPPDWSRVAPADESYGYGGDAYRHPAFGAPSPSDLSVKSWTEGDVKAAMASDAYRKPGHPAQTETRAKVRAWFDRVYGIRPVRRDATGRQIDGPPPPPVDPSGMGGPVHVRAHHRDGGRVAVEAHDRRPPAR